MEYGLFKEEIAKAAQKFKLINKSEIIRVISHLDADGISACAILVKALNRENRRFSISIVHQVDKALLEQLSKESYCHYIFTDLGSGQISTIQKILSDKKIFILDHHKPDMTEITDNITHINPHLNGIDGSKEISGAGVVFLFTKSLDEKNEDSAHIAIIGAIGDVQEDNGFLKLNNEILEIAIKRNKIKVEKGLKFFGWQTRPLHKVLEYSTEIYIPGVTGSESGAIQFLQQLGISPKTGNSWRKLCNLTEKEMQKLVTGIVMKRVNEARPEDILGNIYTIVKEEEGPTRNAKEFATLLNACGRLNKASFGIGACLGDKQIKQRAIRTLTEYKREILNAIKWYEKNKNSEKITKEKGFMIINAKDEIMPTIIGTLASILSNSGNFNRSTFIISMAHIIDGNTKISLRFTDKNKDINLKKLLSEIIAVTGGQTGGHDYAAGALIPTEKDEEFIKAAQEILRKSCLEEVII